MCLGLIEMTNNRTVDLLPAPITLQLNKLHIPTCIFIGKYLSFMPEWNMDFTVVVGPNIQLPKIEEPTTQEIDQYHMSFVAAYRKLFDENKEKYAATGKDAVLEIL